MIGKSGLACHSEDLELPADKGFDHFFGFLDHRAAHRHYPTRLARNGEWVRYPENHGRHGEKHCDELFLEDALRYLDERAEARDQPFFLHLALTVPHADLTVPEEYLEPFAERFEEKPYKRKRNGYTDCEAPRATWAAMVTMIDRSMGRLLDRLEARMLAEHTLVIFASDNGPHFEGGADPEAFDSNGPYRGGKRDLYDGGIRTAQIAWWPGLSLIHI